MPPFNDNMKLLAQSAQSNLARFLPLVMWVQTIIVVLFFVGAGTVIRLAYHHWAAAGSPTEDNRPLLSRPRVCPSSRTAFPVAGVNGGRVYACPTARRPRAPALTPLALESDESFQKKKVDDVERGEPT
ncbi:hypothetical protein BC827DRAFT_1268361 [Russula dissimulans]|nr:hypothetical protein BC827DRAFT_1268361 [Russula dissimulans]